MPLDSTAKTRDVLLGSHPYEIYLALDEMFGDEEWLRWEPETLLLHLRAEVSDLAEDKLLAVQSVASNGNLACTMALAFEKAVLAFTNNVCVMDVAQPPFVEEICYAVPQIKAIIKAVHGKDTKVVFTGEVPGYVASVAKFRGWMALPHRLSFASKALARLNGLSETSTKYYEYERMVDTVRSLYYKMDKPSAEKLLEADVFDSLGEAEKGQLRNLVGGLLFDPTILHR